MRIITYIFRTVRYICWSILWRYRQWRLGTNPYGLYWIDPGLIEYCTSEKFDKNWSRGRVVDGDWDKGGQRFTDTKIFTSLAARFQDKENWTETEYFKRVLAKVDAGEVWRGCKNRAEVEEQFAEFDDLYESIVTRGYVSANLQSWQTADQQGSSQAEVMVCIGRDGEVLFSRSGKHRLAIAKLLGLPKIPVMVLVTHRLYQGAGLQGDMLSQ